MNIQEAAIKAMEIDGIICRKSATRKDLTVGAAVKPTNTYNCCFLLVYREGKPERSSRYWNPTADDLMADDWEVLRDESEDNQKGDNL